MARQMTPQEIVPNKALRSHSLCVAERRCEGTCLRIASTHGCTPERESTPWTSSLAVAVAHDSPPCYAVVQLCTSMCTSDPCQIRVNAAIRMRQIQMAGEPPALLYVRPAHSCGVHAACIRISHRTSWARRRARRRQWRLRLQRWILLVCKRLRVWCPPTRN